MNCKQASPLLSAYLDGELDGRDSIAVRGHVTRCPICEHELEALRSLKRALGALPAAEPPAALESRVRAALAERQATPSARGRTLPWVAATIAIVAIGCAALAMHHGLSDTPDVVATSEAPPIDLNQDRIYYTSDPLSGGHLLIPVGR